MQVRDLLLWLAEWFPILLLLAALLTVMWYLRRGTRPTLDVLAEQKRHNEALEKILADHGARIQKLEDRGA